ncbi:MULTISPECIES: hypothetical protein [Lactiplantibacillus]|uniref:Uncharacterized protein n=1 Tax=Lactiplantibacillus pentosus TaxID=1589 RepID=A0AAW8WFC5_LACPE|nr:MULTISPECIES: hypothetical protein [Lactiplantibacillus]MBU7461517.1 hypothetical protein [Lactiplantibacillus pentosus]MBU7478059.1 hypothetical protein [Lactiplantibacillus pentosus]MBU7484614.1 hypothetical protein [Lactiplantibacillus sp. 30.2.29]MBU7488063.1 hypothetical protein [Lactiplantibacillus pentosus]MBU7493223.1 hypothetical protein [Lactiplantibacillus pentosus]
MDTKNLSSNQISSFLNSLSYWESINLRSTLLKAQNKGMSSEDAYEQATLDYEDPKNLEFDFERALKTGI